MSKIEYIPAQKDKLIGLAVNSKGYIYVVNTDSKEILVYEFKKCVSQVRDDYWLF